VTGRFLTQVGALELLSDESSNLIRTGALLFPPNYRNASKVSLGARGVQQDVDWPDVIRGQSHYSDVS
jgi:hypothetical protein